MTAPEGQAGHCHPEPSLASDAPASLAMASTSGDPRTLLGLPLGLIALAFVLGSVALASTAWIVAFPLEAAAFGGLTLPVVLASGFADGLNPCAFALLVLFATYTLTMVGRVTADGSPTGTARRQVLAAGSLYVGAVWITYFLIGLGLLSFLGWLGEDHLVTRVAVVIALVMGLWMLKDVFLPGVGPSMMAPAASHGWMHRAMERGGLGAMLIAGVLVSAACAIAGTFIVLWGLAFIGDALAHGVLPGKKGAALVVWFSFGGFLEKL